MGGKIGKKLVGAGLIVGGVVIGVSTGHWAFAASVVSTGIGLLTQPQLNLEGPSDALAERQGALLEVRTGARQPLPVVYGTTKIAGVVVDVRVDPDSFAERRLVVVMAFCLGSQDGSGIESFEEFWFDDRLAISGTLIQDPFDDTAPDGGGVRFLEFGSHLGTDAQTVDARLFALFSLGNQWPTAAKGAGIAYGRFELWFSTEIYSSSVPTIRAVIQGNKVFDPRDSSTAHSSNPALCIRDYLTSVLYGLGVSEANIDDDSFIDMANYCDELVTDPDGVSQRRFALNGSVDTGRSVEQNLADLCTACRGQVVNEGDKWRILIRRDRPVSGFQIDEHNTVDGSWSFVLPGVESAANIVRSSFVDPEQNYEVDTVQWPEPGDSNAYLAEDNDYEQRLEIDLPYTDKRSRAQQIAMTLMKESRDSIGVICTLKEEALRVRVGDLVEVSYPTPGWSAKVFDVVALLLQTDGCVRAVLVEYEPSAYDYDVQSPSPVIPDTNLPDPFTVPSPSTLVLTGFNQGLQTNDGRWIPRIRVTWGSAANAYVDHYEVEAKRATDDDWDQYGRPKQEDELFFVYPVTDEEWDVRIRTVNRLGAHSEWVEDSVLVVTDDPRPQITSITMAHTHSDTHTDTHSDVAHVDVAHADSHTDSAFVDTHNDSHTDAHFDTAHSDVAHSDVAHDDSHLDMHTDAHTDDAHTDGHSDVHGDGDLHMDSHADVAHGDSHADATSSEHGDAAHTDSHSDVGHADDHTDSHTDAHTDTAHADTHSDDPAESVVHSDGHADAHSDGSFGIGVALQADTDSASVRAVARKHGDVAAISHTDGSHGDVAHTDVTDPTAAEVRDQEAVDGRNVVISLIDVETGAEIVLSPGDRVRIGALAYSVTGGEGVEGPLGLGSASLFNVAPVGANQWFPA